MQTYRSNEHEFVLEREGYKITFQSRVAMNDFIKRLATEAEKVDQIVMFEQARPTLKQQSRKVRQSEKNKIDTWFNPEIHLTVGQEIDSRTVLEQAKKLAETILQNCPNGPDRNSALKELRQVAFFAVSAIHGG